MACTALQVRTAQPRDPVSVESQGPSVWARSTQRHCRVPRTQKLGHQWSNIWTKIKLVKSMRAINLWSVKLLKLQWLNRRNSKGRMKISIAWLTSESPDMAVLDRRNSSINTARLQVCILDRLLPTSRSEQVLLFSSVRVDISAHRDGQVPKRLHLADVLMLSKTLIRCILLQILRRHLHSSSRRSLAITRWPHWQSKLNHRRSQWKRRQWKTKKRWIGSFCNRHSWVGKIV